MFSKAVQNYNYNATTVTTNGMKAHVDTGSAVLDLFGKMSLRGIDLTNQFMAALAEDEELAIRVMLWGRDIREGAGERAQFRALLSKLEAFNPASAAAVMHKVPELGRWDDLFTYTDFFNRKKAFNMIQDALTAGNGLAAKWMPRKGPIAVELTKFLGLSPKAYRKLIVSLTNVVEQQMCAGNWTEINFSHVPSVASARYQKALGRHAPEQYSAYIAELKKPVADRKEGVKINAGAVYPYDVVKSVTMGNVAVADEQWKALPNYVGDASVFAIVDTSGSMSSRVGSSNMSAGDVAMSLGLYVSEKNRGPFADLLMIFSESPKLLQLKGTLSQRMRSMGMINAQNTNISKAFDLLLDIAVKGDVASYDMPQVLLILSDMQFDYSTSYRSAVWGFNENAKEMIAREYKAAGYEVPKLVFWNLTSDDHRNTPVKFDDLGVAHVSGFSPSILKSVLSNDLADYTPYNVMLKTIMKDRYAFL